MTPEDKIKIGKELAYCAGRSCAFYLVYSKDDPDEMGKILQCYINAGGSDIRAAFFTRNTKNATELQKECYKTFYETFCNFMLYTVIRPGPDDGTVQAMAMLKAGRTVHGPYSSCGALWLALREEANKIREGVKAHGNTELAGMILNDTTYNALFN